MSKKYKYSEIFTSIQGEGVYTGVPSIWLRWFLCNLQCNGFGQKQPENPETHILPYKDFDVSTVSKIEELPVWDYGCDSSYSWSKKYKHLCPEHTVSEIVDKLELELKQFKDNPEGRFSLPSMREVKDVHLCLTGGEPMMPKTQDATIELLMELAERTNLPRFITVETNGTQSISDELGRIISSYVASGGEWFWSVSPKLLYTSGERPERAINPAVVKTYQDITGKGQLKFVVSNRPEAWDELEERVNDFREAGIHWPVWIMPVGATIESQSDDDMRAVVDETIKRGYNVSARLQAYIWGNTIGT
jgi:6-pyruvoyltetrahydropterin 2'-reductase